VAAGLPTYTVLMWLSLMVIRRVSRLRVAYA
jgi:hypothetical protein